jgi:CubicO group peptidase (beta-lactamase class C family)
MHVPLRSSTAVGSMLAALTFSIAALGFSVSGFAQPISSPAIPTAADLNQRVHSLMASTHANGIAVAVIDHGKVSYVHAFGIRNAKGDPLNADTIMYGASLTKTVFAYTVLQLVDQGKLKLDTPIKDDLDKPLPTYGPDPVFPDRHGPYPDLADDPRWQRITPRMCLTHSTGFNNFYFIEPDQKLRIHFDPGTQFSYTAADFKRLGMTRTSLTFLNGAETNFADGWNDQGQPQPHSQRKKPRAAGSMNTTITDFAQFAAALVRGDGLSAASRAEMVKPSLHIGTAHLFPDFAPQLPAAQQRKDLAAGLGVIVFDGPQGHGFYKGGHDGQTANTMVCIEKSERCAVILSNDVRAEAGYADLVHFILGDTGVPFDWEYGDYAGKS